MSKGSFGWSHPVLHHNKNMLSAVSLCIFFVVTSLRCFAPNQAYAMRLKERERCVQWSMGQIMEISGENGTTKPLDIYLTSKSRGCNPMFRREEDRRRARWTWPGNGQLDHHFWVGSISLSYCQTPMPKERTRTRADRPADWRRSQQVTAPTVLITFFNKIFIRAEAANLQVQR